MNRSVLNSFEKNKYILWNLTESNWTEKHLARLTWPEVNFPERDSNEQNCTQLKRTNVFCCIYIENLRTQKSWCGRWERQKGMCTCLLAGSPRCHWARRRPPGVRTALRRWTPCWTGWPCCRCCRWGAAGRESDCTSHSTPWNTQHRVTHACVPALTHDTQTYFSFLLLRLYKPRAWLRKGSQPS